MKWIAEASENSEVSLVGGKGHHLQKLIRWGAPVPSFFIITTDCFKYYREKKQFPDEVTNKFQDFFEKHPDIALRSSMISEDHIDSSFAGMFETLLDVNANNWKESLVHIFSSVDALRVKEYIAKKKIQVDLQMAVVVQELVTVEKSGVLFTRSPIIPTAAVAIDAGIGMGEGVVSGHVDVDHFLLTRNQEIIHKKLNHAEAVLNDQELLELLNLGLKLEQELCVPADIEWGQKNNHFYIFQIRPITRSFNPLKYFVDTNLSESYPGTVSPFTAGFVKKAYENVFRESAVLLGAEGVRFKTLCSHYEKLISAVDDHLYYNLEHYYAVLRALPGGEKNIDNWHKMIGGKVDGNLVPYHNTVLSSVETVLAVKSLLSLAFRRKNVFQDFLNRLENLKSEIERKTEDSKDPKELILYLNELINKPIGFGLTVVNDVFIMIGLGIITKRLKKRGLHEDIVIDLLKTEHDVDSIRPLEKFNQVVAQLSQKFIDTFSQQELVASINPYEKLFEKLQSENFEDEVKILEEFIDLYGDRSFEELKLESLPLKNDPLLLKQLIVWAKKNPSLVHQSKKQKVDIHIGWFFGKVLDFTRDAIAMREATRLWRGKFYHLLRQLVLNLSHEMKKDKAWKEFSILDFFSLSHEEWLDYANGKRSIEEIQTLIKNRSVWQTKKQHYPEIIPWVEDEPLPKNDFVTTESSLHGQGVSQGITEGIALVLENPNEALDSEYKDFILVTKNTDPAWVYIMSRSKGLISEKGSLLSHTAIIGRELNIPTIVGVKGATHKIVSGQRLRMDAAKGTIEII